MSHIYSRMTPEQQRERDERDLQILALRESGASVAEIAITIGVHEQTVFKFLRAMKDYL